MENLNEFGKKIKSFREAKKLTQEELAKQMGYTSRSTINKIEKGIIDIPQSKIMSFARVLEVSPWDLMGWNDIKWNSNTKLKLNEEFNIKIFDSDKSDIKKIQLEIGKKNETGFQIINLIVNEVQIKELANKLLGAIDNK